MNTNFYIVDDDKAVQNVLKNIIIKNNLGDLLGMSDNGNDAIEDIKKMNPDIVLVDLLLPGIDGLSIVSTLRKIKCKASFIMISEVNSKEMISKAYQNGVEFFINKPINVIEVISVIGKVKEKISMAEVISSFQNAIRNMDVFKNHTLSNDTKMDSKKNKIERILAQLGTLGEAGNDDIIELISWLLDKDESYGKSLPKYKMSQLYNYLKDRYKNEHGISINVSTIEQRIRRTINRALKNIANLGIEDYGNEVFIKYSSTLFDFREVRQQMDYARGKSSYGGKINVRKFIEGIIVTLKNDV